MKFKISNDTYTKAILFVLLNTIIFLLIVFGVLKTLNLIF